MNGTVDWGALREAFEAGEPVAALAARFDVTTQAIHARACKQDWGGRRTQRRRRQLVDMLLKAAEKVVQADSAAEAERRAKALSAVAAVAKAVREFDPKLAEACAAPEGDDGEDAKLRRDFDAEIERLIEERVNERLRAARADG